MYICLGLLKIGFRNGCRPLFGLDGCNLKGPCGGQLLAAVATDTNDGMYSLAWAVVEAENNDSWNWFLENLKDNMKIENDGAFTFISDKQKSLINALEVVFPNVEHRFCVMHLYKNMWKEHKSIGLSRKCFEWLSEKPRSQCSRSAFKNLCRSDMFVNNHCEVFNNTIRKYRDLPIIFMLKVIHTNVMVRIKKRRDKILNIYALNPVCPNAMRRLNKATYQSKGCHVIWSGGARYLVTMSTGGYEMVVDLEAHTCACKKWDLSGGTTSAAANVNISGGTTNGALSGVSENTIVEGTQVGVLHNMTTRAKVQKTPLNIEAHQTNVQGQGTTTTRAHIEARRRQMEAYLSKHPVWKI
ncbi:uncharacterized protein LOC141690919 [Apium graveolens]|uniref:uncharacterized protein LOC141690919 n=1 Tax=Apium graveolens TaxID=4045 RepID=UPI003D7AA5FE